MKKWMIAVVVLAVIAVGVGAFFGGRAAGGGAISLQAAMTRIQNATEEERQQTFQNENVGSNGQGGFPGALGNGQNRGDGMVSGSIIAADASSITVETSDGSTKIVLISGSTTVSKTTDASVSDLTVGQTVLVNGTTNSDGSVTATRVELGVTTRQSASPEGAAPSSTTTTVAQ